MRTGWRTAPVFQEFNVIGRLRGTLAEKQPPHLILDVNGLGYELEVPMTTLYRLPPVGQPLTLHTHLVVREDAQLLYGFYERRERELFRELIRLNGVGPKLALALMSSLEVDELVRCVQAQDTSALVRVPGVGKKTAERLLVELKDRFKAWEAVPAMFELVPGEGAMPRGPVATAETDAVSALVSLGYKPQEASKAVAAVNEKGLSSEDLIRRALKGMI
jgi:Holliday junction DNA helicase RuvA